MDETSYGSVSGESIKLICISGMHAVATLLFEAKGSSMNLRNRLIAAASVALALSMPGALSAATLQDKVQFAYSIGTQAGKQYCANKAAQEAMEKGTAIAMGQTNMPMSVISEMDFEDDRYTLPMIEGMISYAIDHCPQRAKRLFSDLYRMAD